MQSISVLLIVALTVYKSGVTFINNVLLLGWGSQSDITAIRESVPIGSVPP